MVKQKLFLTIFYITSFTSIVAEDLTDTEQTKTIQVDAKQTKPIQIGAKQTKPMKLTPVFDFELILLEDKIIFADLAKNTNSVGSIVSQKILGLDIQGGLKMQWMSLSLLPYLQYQNKGKQSQFKHYSLAVGTNLKITKVKNLILGFDLAYLGEIQQYSGKTFSGGLRPARTL